MIVFDTETTGLLKPHGTPLDKQPKIIEFAAIKLSTDLKEIGRISFLCNPGELLQPRIIQITNITNHMLKNEKTFAHYYEELHTFFEGEDTLVAHNVAFDWHVLKYELQRIGKEKEFPWPSNKVCTVVQSMPLKGYRLKLSDLYKFTCNDTMKEAHRAMVDVEALVQCVRAMKGMNLL